MVRIVSKFVYGLDIWVNLRYEFFQCAPCRVTVKRSFFSNFRIISRNMKIINCLPIFNLLNCATVHQSEPVNEMVLIIEIDFCSKDRRVVESKIKIGTYYRVDWLKQWVIVEYWSIVFSENKTIHSVGLYCTGRSLLLLI